MLSKAAVVCALLALASAVPSGVKKSTPASRLFAHTHAEIVHHAPHPVVMLDKEPKHAHHAPKHLSLAAVANTTGASNASRPHPATILKSVEQLPFELVVDGVVVVSGGICRQMCRPSEAKVIENWSWNSNGVSYRLDHSVNNDLIVQNVLFKTNGGNSENSLPAQTGSIPVLKESSKNATSAKFESIKAEFECRSTGVETVHVMVADPTDFFRPVHFFIKAMCSVPESEGCGGVNCAPHGVCVNGSCYCAKGFSGPFCKTWEFNGCPTQCNGNGAKCVDGACVCKPGFSGVDCGTYTGCTHLNRCHGHGKCIDDQACACDSDWTGRTCSEERAGDEFCASQSYCRGHGTCVRDSTNNGYMCECHTGYEGKDCSLAVSDSCKNGCSGHGVCAGSVCVCNFGFSGESCEEAFSPCGGCKHGSCTEKLDSAEPKCECDEGFAGHHCTIYDHTTDPCKQQGFCSGHGECLGDVCVCASGFGGVVCDSVVSDGCLKGCSNHGLCDSLTDTCKCESGWSGDDCSVSRCAAHNGTVCSGHGACVVEQNSNPEVMKCVCVGGFSGSSCQNTVCNQNTTCSGHGTCKKTSGQWDTLCQCHDEWSGPACDVSSAPAVHLNEQNTNQNIHNIHNTQKVAEGEDSEDLDDFLDTAP